MRRREAVKNEILVCETMGRGVKAPESFLRHREAAKNEILLCETMGGGVKTPESFLRRREGVKNEILVCETTEIRCEGSAIEFEPSGSHEICNLFKILGYNSIVRARNRFCSTAKP